MILIEERLTIEGACLNPYQGLTSLVRRETGNSDSQLLAKNCSSIHVMSHAMPGMQQLGMKQVMFCMGGRF